MEYRYVSLTVLLTPPPPPPMPMPGVVQKLFLYFHTGKLKTAQLRGKKCRPRSDATFCGI